jgi:hypothetical protein
LPIWVPQTDENKKQSLLKRKKTLFKSVVVALISLLLGLIGLASIEYQLNTKEIKDLAFFQ